MLRYKEKTTIQKIADTGISSFFYMTASLIITMVIDAMYHHDSWVPVYIATISLAVVMAVVAANWWKEHSNPPSTNALPNPQNNNGSILSFLTFVPCVAILVSLIVWLYDLSGIVRTNDRPTIWLLGGSVAVITAQILSNKTVRNSPEIIWA